MSSGSAETLQVLSRNFRPPASCSSAAPWSAPGGWRRASASGPGPRSRRRPSSGSKLPPVSAMGSYQTDGRQLCLLL